jgi:hypothetical protein
VVDTLEWLSSAAAVLVHRRVFGPGAWQEQPWGLVIERDDRRVPDDDPANRHVRTLARCGDLLDVMENPREFRVSGQVFNTAGHLAPNCSVQAQPCYQNLVINHYAARSRQDWQAKRERDAAAAGAASPADEAASFEALAAACQVHDTTIQAFAGAVRELLGLDPAAQPAFDADPNLGMVSPVGLVAPMGPATPVVVTPNAGQSSPVVVAPAMPALFMPAPAMPAPASPAPAVPAPSTVAAPVPVPQSVVAAVQAALMPYAAALNGARPEPRPGVAMSTQVEGAPAWVRRGQDAQERTGGLGLVFRDRSRAGEHWLAALRGAAVGAIDPAFLMDEYDRIRDFPTDDAARAACDAALAQGPKH